MLEFFCANTADIYITRMGYHFRRKVSVRPKLPFCFAGYKQEIKC